MHVSTVPTLSWEAAAGAATYCVQVSLNPQFTTYVLNDSTMTTTSRAIGSPNGTGQLAGFTDHYWRVSAKNSAGTSAYSTIFRFTTGEPVALRPSDGQVTPLTLRGASYVRIALPRAEVVMVRLHDARGRATKVWDGPLEAGLHTLPLPMVAGVSVLEFRAGAVRKAVLVSP
jgi:hypothetical protein